MPLIFEHDPNKARRNLRKQSMKKAVGTRTRHDPDMLDEYDFSKGVRGKHADEYAKGTNVVASPHVAQVFPDSDSLNEALRTLV